MPLFLDTHRNVPGLTADAAAAAHARDVEVQGRHSVRYRRTMLADETEVREGE